jgi:hypothetical protein
VAELWLVLAACQACMLGLPTCLAYAVLQLAPLLQADITAHSTAAPVPFGWQPQSLPMHFSPWLVP